jgi:hypothetical protein
MRLGGALRLVGYVAGSRAAGAGHSLRRRSRPEEWTRRDPHHILWVAPDEIVATTTERIDESLRGRIIDGDWDLAAIPLRSLRLWRGLEQRIIEGRDWHDTELALSRPVSEAPNVGTRLTTDDPAALEERFRRLDALILSLRRDGWLPHHSVGAPFVREMAVVVGRDGALLRNSGGLHRTIVAQLLGIPWIPCRVLVEHREAPADAPR